MRRITDKDLEQTLKAQTSGLDLPPGFSLCIGYAYGGTKLELRHNHCVYRDSPGYGTRRETYGIVTSDLTGWAADAWKWAACFSRDAYYNTGKRQTVTSENGRVKLVTSGKGFVLYLRVRDRKTPIRLSYSLSDPWAVGRAAVSSL